ncbi:flagellar hook-length control protein FliK [Sinorhizobium alkalisoli]|uniref:Uncharacterized protein n=1 Tax=Sinorhizobium alkalisoli TaxID=1752398 RepID=A0A1E3VAC8_9HYPH|nr:flagellar hook-length control protein FliK [Sinorhizobium alkalisoli]MCA1489385.1 flagellar hook-length control protein FliK [Ensifer sp. NBAIM29]MCG5480402.1 flagellar hook-length control protein FliK [Sinorhizobium alkalisoli]ODR89776.1 hypothetical protein A8M32_16420 [Sinorhizobium alkalisoli]QFI65134.1 Flagellar hook-length control protein FliK [Sinorhizobium alkalisoli]
MNPLNETLRAPAAVSGSGSRQGGRDQRPGEAGAFETAVVDAARKKGPGQKAAPDSAQSAADAAATDSQLAADVVLDRSGKAMLAASDAVGTSDGLGAAVNETPSQDGQPQVANARQKALTRLQQLAGGMIPERGAAVEDEAPGRTGAAKGGKAHQAAVSAERGDAVDDEAPDAGTASSEPTAGAVNDLLGLLGGPVQAATSVPAEGKATRMSGERNMAGHAAKIDAGELATADDHSATNGSDDGATDQLFRFARADGKGQAVSMNISADGEHVAVESGGSSPAARAEAITVLEARRYLGVAMNPNSASVTSAIAGDAEWVQALQSSLSLTQPEALGQAGKTLNTLKIQMHPIDLGTVTATLRLKDDELQVELKVETGDAYRQLRDDQGEMVRALRAQGFAVDQVNITLSAGGDTSSGNGSQAQAGSGQSGRERAGEGNGEGRQRQDGSQAAAAERWTGNDGTDDASTGAERARAGYVYM